MNVFTLDIIVEFDYCRMSKYVIDIFGDILHHLPVFKILAEITLDSMTTLLVSVYDIKISQITNNIDFSSFKIYYRKRLTAEQCFNHPWLAQTEEDMNKVVLSTDKLKKFIIRRKWQVRNTCTFTYKILGNLCPQTHKSLALYVDIYIDNLMLLL